jgi:uncharacterized protein (DUF1330 family)
MRRQSAAKAHRKERHMNTRYKIALAMLAGAGLGAAAIQGLNAQTKPPAYVVVAVRIKDADAFKTGVVDKATPAALATAGGHYVVHTHTITSLDGTPPERLALIAFDSVEKAQAWSNSPGTKEITAARMKSTDSLSFIVEGFFAD